jgi:hypothetical protein
VTNASSTPEPPHKLMTFSDRIAPSRRPFIWHGRTTFIAEDLRPRYAQGTFSEATGTVESAAQPPRAILSCVIIRNSTRWKRSQVGSGSAAAGSRILSANTRTTGC